MSKQVNIDLVSSDKSQGELASKLAGGLNVNMMRPYIGDDGKTYYTQFNGGSRTNPKNYQKKLMTNAAATLRPDEWKELDSAVETVAKSTPTGFQYFIDRGLTYNLNNGLGTTVLKYQNRSDALEAELSMSGADRTKNDKVEYTTNYLPLPIIHSDYEINRRFLAESRNGGNPMDTIMAQLATEKVLEFREKMLFTDKDYSFGGGTIHSFVNATNRNTGTISTAWDAASVTGEDIVSDVLDMKSDLLADHQNAAKVLIIPSNYDVALDKDYSGSKGSNTIRERLQAISGIEDIIVVDALADDNVLLVNLSPSTIRIVNGMGLSNIQWQEQGGWVNKFKTMLIQVPQIRSDGSKQSGIAHYSTA